MVRYIGSFNSLFWKIARFLIQLTSKNHLCNKGVEEDGLLKHVSSLLGLVPPKPIQLQNVTTTTHRRKPDTFSLSRCCVVISVLSRFLHYASQFLLISKKLFINVVSIVKNVVM